MKDLSSPPIADGRTAEIYLWDDQHILKLYRDWCPPDWVEYELRIAHAVYEAGVPSPAAGEIVEVNGRRGLIYERLEGTSMLQNMNARPWTLVKQARLLAELQIKIHEQSVPDLPSYKDRLRFDIRRSQVLKEELKEKILSQLEDLPDGQVLCHGDYHPANIILSQNGPVVIDWMTACSGSPWADVARTSMLLSIGPKGAGNLVSPLVRIVIRLCHRAYLSRYLALRPDAGLELNSWAPVIAAARLSENIPAERDALLEIVTEA